MAVEYFNCTGGTGNYKVGGAVAFFPGLFTALPHTTYVAKPVMDEWNAVSNNNIFVNENPTVATINDIAAPSGVNTAAIVTYPAITGRRHCINAVITSFSGTPAGAELIIQSNATVIARHFVNGNLPTELLFNYGMAGNTGESMTITLTAAGGSCIGRLQVINHQVISAGNNV